MEFHYNQILVSQKYLPDAYNAWGLARFGEKPGRETKFTNLWQFAKSTMN